jgi:crotonobetainyl-CoA:carnitine CoA-transferase CaiB-like acyl-CoA transferase
MAAIMLGDQLGGEAFDPPIGPWGYQRMLAPERKPYRTADGYIAVLPYYPQQWSRFFAALGRSHLYDGDPRFATPARQLANINDLYATVASIMVERTTAEWLALLRRIDIAAMPVYSIPDLIEDPHLADVGFFEEVEHPTEGWLRQIRTPSRWSQTQPGAQRPTPHAGEHSAEVLREVGYGEDEIQALIVSEVVRQWTCDIAAAAQAS